MTTYKKSGVDIKAGDSASKIAYSEAKKTFESRKGLFGKPVKMDGGFAGALDFGDFYLIQNCDGVGSKIAVADAVKKYDTLGYDLLAMVTDDAVCVGAETISITNTVDTEKVSAEVIGEMMKGLRKACIEQKIVIPGGEIAELPGLVKGNSWNSTAVGIVEKSKFITGKNVKPGDKIIGLKSAGFRSNGFSLVRHILEKNLGKSWFKKSYKGKRSWGEQVLTPSKIYSAALLEILGRYKKERKVDVKAVVHVTGGGIPGNIVRILNGKGARVDNLPEPHEMMLKLMEMGQVSDKEAYKVWNMGVGMILISSEFEQIRSILSKNGVDSLVIGEVTGQTGIHLTSRG
ncbi:phosphoribosylformylglycinamidine cyclo-ligase, partial [Candidatus Peregrinibacteria bacterium]|nr:phosphoribosylformylglycinamidine cyclo-ligase [Candidatus Peregrinibacteria bacterium]